MDNFGSNFRNYAINIINHRETNLVISSLIVLFSIYVTFVSVLRRPFFDPLISSIEWPIAYNVSDLIEDYEVDYNRSIMSFLIMWMCALILGRLISYTRLPALLGVLLVGIMFKNVPFMAESVLIDKETGDILRLAALSVVVVRAAMGFDLGLFKKSNAVIFRLGVLSTLCEVIAIVLAAHFIFNVSVGMAVLFGLVLAPSASAVILPSLLILVGKGHGVGSHFCDIFISSIPIDNLLCILAFSVSISVVFAVNIPSQIGIIFAQLAIGTIVGITAGVTMWLFPKCDGHYSHFLRFLLIMNMSFASLFASNTLHCLPAGIVASILLTVISALRWRIDNRSKTIKEERAFAVLFDLFAVPILFGLIGYDFGIAQLDMRMVLEGFAIAGVGMLVRTVIAFILSFFAGLSLTEQALISVILVSKATIQAVLSPYIVDECSERTECDDRTAVMMRTVCVFAIIITAPLGQLVLLLLGPSIIRKRNAVQCNLNGTLNNISINPSNDNANKHYQISIDHTSTTDINAHSDHYL